MDLVWNVNNGAPKKPLNEVWILEDKYTGESVQDKFKRIAEKIPEGSNLMLVTTLDDIAWMLNLRGSDISFNPLFFSYLIFDKTELSATLFIDQEKV